MKKQRIIAGIVCLACGLCAASAPKYGLTEPVLINAESVTDLKECSVGLASTDFWTYYSRKAYRIIFATIFTGYGDSAAIEDTVKGVYSTNNGIVTLSRNGNTYQMNTLSIEVKTTADNNESGNCILDMSEFNEILGVDYARTEGDVITIEGTWTNGNYQFILNKFAIVVGENDTLSIDEDFLFREKIAEYKQQIETMYPLAAYSGSARVQYEEVLANLEAATTLTAAEVRFIKAKETISTLEHLSMLSGAAVRLNGEKKGLRFTAELGKLSEETRTNSRFYMMIVPKRYLEHFAITDEYYTKLLAALREYTEQENPYIATMEATPFRYTEGEIAASGGVYKEGYWYIRGSLTSVQPDNLATDFFAIAYRVDREGKYHYAYFAEGTNVRSLAWVASKALEDPYAQYTEEERAILREYAAALPANA